ncbi:hypothetical protein UlMin_044430 [Ulmus minor]
MAKPITILSIDGGGVRGIIPGVMLHYLESELQKLEQSTEARLADYFDVISGTSTGGLITTMIAAPDERGRPLYAANQIVPFYKKHCPHIFPRSGNWLSHHNKAHGEMHLKMLETSDGDNESVAEEFRYDAKIEESGGIKKPYYDGKYLHKLAKDTLGDKRLHDITLTKIVIPAYDIKKLSPVVFSSYQVDDGNKKLDAFLSDICISTSAAPVYLPAYKFNNEGVEFNCIDGRVAANNPTVAAITEAVKKRSEETDGDKEIDLNDFRLLVLSLGTGEYKEEKYTAALANSWWAINWLIYPIRTFWKADHPLPEILFDANSDMNDYYCTMFFESFRNPENFLRVQDDKLPKELSRLDNGTPANLDKLEQYAKNLLNKPVTTLNSATFDRDEIEEFAKKLYDMKHSQKVNTKVKVNKGSFFV